MDPLNFSKSDARKASRAAVREISERDRETHSASIRLALANHLHSARGTLLAFAPLPLEPDLMPLLVQMRQLKFAFPLVTGEGSMTLHLVESPDQLTKSTSPIREPDPLACPRVAASQVSIALVPGLAFEPTNGFRLGHGGGFYDRLLANPSFAAETIGVAFSCQLAVPFPVEHHDQPVSKLLTEKGLCPLGDA